MAVPGITKNIPQITMETSTKSQTITNIMDLHGIMTNIKMTIAEE